MLCRAAAEDRRSFSETASLVKSRLLVVSLVAGRRRGANHSSTGLASSPIESAIAGTGVVLRVAFLQRTVFVGRLPFTPPNGQWCCFEVSFREISSPFSSRSSWRTQIRRRMMQDTSDGGAIWGST